MAPIVFAYWKTRSLGQPVRLILGYGKVDFEDRMYVVDDTPPFSRSSWYDVKHTIGLDFPNLPYLIDGEVKITQSNAILRYLARKLDLIGETEEQLIRMDLIENQAMDFRSGFWNLCYGSNKDNFKQNSDDYREKVKSILVMFDRFLGTTHKWFAGGKLTFVDFIMYEALDQLRLFDEKLLVPYDNLKNFMISFKTLPEVREFMESEKCFKGDINNPSAMFK